MCSLKFRPSWKLFVLLFLLGIFLGGCAQASELQQALGSEPRALNPSCPVILGDVDWLNKRTFMPASIVELTANPFTARLRFPTSSGSEDRWLTITDYYALDCAKAGYFSNGGYCVQNMTEVETCITGQFPGLTLEPASLPSGVPTVSPNATSMPAMPNSQQQPSISIPQIVVYHWEKPNGERVEFKTIEEAKNALASSWEGGKIVMETRLPNLNGGYTSLGFAELEGSYVPPFSPPPGVTLNDPSATYFKAVEQNKFFATLEEALAYAQSQNSATTINQMARGVDYGTAQQVAEFQPITAKNSLGQEMLLDAATPYIQVTMHTAEGITQTSHYTTDNKEAAIKLAYSARYKSTIDVYKRGAWVSNIETVESWDPPTALIAAFDGSFYDLSIPYWVFMPISTNPNPTYFKTKELAVEFGESYIEHPCNFPGGLVTQFVRTTPKTDPYQVLPWACPEGLPESWDPKNTYYERGGKYYPTLKEAVKSDYVGWYLSPKKQQINLLRREVNLESPKKNWWTPWQLIALGLYLLWLLYKWLKEKPEDELVESVSIARRRLKYYGKIVRRGVYTVLGIAVLLYLIPYLNMRYGNFIVVLVLVGVGAFYTLFMYLTTRAYKERKSEKKEP